MSLAPRPGYRRQECRCGCGVWFYDSRDGARHPRWYANPEHYRNDYNRKRREQRAALAKRAS